MKFYLTTAIDYPNALPHIGTAFEKIGADIQARYRRFIGNEVYFLMGNDENTLRVAGRARSLGKDPKEYVDEMAESFKQIWRDLDISFDDFIQTTEERHKIGVTLFLETVREGGFIYKKNFTGLYCDGCESFKTPKDIIDNHCEHHKNLDLREVEEENYFFKLSLFKDRILKLIDKDIVVLPRTRYNEVKNFVEAELEDISISRKNAGWGIPIPWDDSQVIYVWFDALLNYLTGIGFGTDWEKFHKWYPADVHLIGKDITRFHCAMFPAMIMAYNEKAKLRIDLPKSVFAHGFLYERKNNEVLRFSKSNNNSKPEDLLALAGSDVYRYYFMSRCDYGNDGEFSLEKFVECNNTDLANNLGNLVSRVVSMASKYCDGKLFGGGCPMAINQVQRILEETADAKYKDALQAIWYHLTAANKQIEYAKPWNTYKTNPVHCRQTLHQLAMVLRNTSLLIKPYMPKASKIIWNTFLDEQGLTWEQANKSVLEYHVTRNVPLTVNKELLVEGNYQPIFKRIK